VEEFEQKYNEAMMFLQDAAARFMDHLSLWADEWRKFSDSEKSNFCPQSASPETGDPSPAAVVETTPPPATDDSCHAAATATEQLTPSANEDIVVAAVVPQTLSVNSRRRTHTAAASCSQAECGDDEDDDYDDVSSRNKKWNCYTVFIKEGLAHVNLTKVTSAVRPMLSAHVEQK